MSFCTIEFGLGWNVVPPSGTDTKSARLGLKISRAITWYHSRETPPASIPSSPLNWTLSLYLSSSAVRLRSWWKLGVVVGLGVLLVVG